MISNIVDSNGLLVYTGNDVDGKFATVLARAGHQRVDGDIPQLEYPKWNGTDWIEGKTALQTWTEDMANSDSTMIPRWLEDHIRDDHGGVAGNANLQAKYDAKVALRNSKPS